jgi:transposase
LSFQHIAFLERQEKRLNPAIAERMQAIPHTLDTIPGFGPVFSAGIMSEIASVDRFDYNQAKVAKFAGLKWRKHQSADFQAEETRLTRTGNRYLHYYLCEAANTVRMRAPECAAYYDRKYHMAHYRFLLNLTFHRIAFHLPASREASAAYRI